MSARGILISLSLVCLALPAQAGPTRYDSLRAGHPLRIAAYAAHPFGVILDTLIFHPAWWLGQHEPLRTLFGVQTQLDDRTEVRLAQVEPGAERDVESPEPGKSAEPEPLFEPGPSSEPDRSSEPEPSSEPEQD
jgi:hypothetical protein